MPEGFNPRPPIKAGASSEAQAAFGNGDVFQSSPAYKGGRFLNT